MFVENEWKLDESGGGHFIETYDLMGAVMKGKTLDWVPWLEMSGCQGPTQPCTNATGLTADLMQELKAMFNFTLELYKEESGEWGNMPMSGNWGDPNATWGGALGTIVNDEFDIPLSSWMYVPERTVDATWHFATAINYGVFINLGKNLPDYGVFTRPFTTMSWCAIMAIVGMTLLVYFLLVTSFKGFEFWTSYKILVNSLWLFFLLASAYYGGALTMFFSTTPPLPFLSSLEGLRLHPKWKMTIVAGHETVLAVQDNDNTNGVYEDFLDRARKTGDILPTYVAAFERLRDEPGYFLFGEMMEKPPPGLDLHRLPSEYLMASVFVLPKNSPWTRMINKGIGKLKQAGTLDRMLSKWFFSRAQEGNKGVVEAARSLASGQLVLLAVLFGGILIAVLVIFVGELLHARCSKK